MSGRMRGESGDFCGRGVTGKRVQSRKRMRRQMRRRSKGREMPREYHAGMWQGPGRA